MPNEWDASIQIDETLAVALIEQQFPMLSPVHVASYGAGWDNVAYLVNERWVFRFPRRVIAAKLLEREARILPLLASALPVAIPVPTFVGTPQPNYPCTFAGYERVEGRTACRSQCSLEQRAALAPALGRFLQALHGIPIDAATAQWAPDDEIERTVLRKRLAKIHQRIIANPAGLDEQAVQSLIEQTEKLSWTPPTQTLHWVHGDFYGRHLILDDRCELNGVIDWGDVHRGDPALDLSIAFSFLPPTARDRFRAAYGPIDDATWTRARWRGIHYGALLAEYGHNIGDQEIFALGQYALQNAPVD
jgi:aminoglycoside phosphotransferase (APT) family kinase protein